MPVSRRRKSTRERIIDAAAARLRKHGVAAVTLDAVGADLGVTKQAILYHFGSKEGLLNEIVVVRVEAESALLRAAVAEARDAPDAIERFVLAFVDHYVADLPGFRLLYVVPNLAADGVRLLPEYGDRLHAATGAAYAALEQAIRADRRTPRTLDARRLAVSVHMAAMGHVLLHGVAVAADDPLRHGVRPLAVELVRALSAAWR